ncbi:MAG: hypothetical protein ACXVXO_12510 [Mycobacteriaceae bacterium]
MVGHFSSSSSGTGEAFATARLITESRRSLYRRYDLSLRRGRHTTSGAAMRYRHVLAAAFIASCMVVGAIVGAAVSLVRQMLEREA